MSLTNADLRFDPLPPTMEKLAGDCLPPDSADAPPLRWAILGAGHIAHKFARDVVKANGQIVAVGSQSAERAERFAAEESVPFAGSYDEVLARGDVDAVYVATTHNFHLENALAAIAAGKPVLIEKPITVTPDELNVLRTAATEAGVLVMEAMWSRFLPIYPLIRGLLRGDELGEVTYVRAEHDQCLRGVQRMEEPGLAGGAALDLGVYPASFIHWILGKPDEIVARGHLTDKGVDLDAAAIFTYPTSLGIYESSMGSKTATSGVVSCTRGFIELPYNFYRPSTIRLVLNEEEGRPGVDESWSIDLMSDRGFEYQAAAFARAHAQGLTEVPDHGFDEAMEVMEILHEIRGQLGI